jgi:hypothetical protein
VHAQTKTTTITFNSPQVLPGDRTYLSIELSNSGEDSVSRLEHWIEIPTRKISYGNARQGIAADMAGALLKVEETLQEEDILILHLSIQGREPIPDGAVVEISLDVADIEPETLILTHRVEAFDDQGKKILDLDFSDARLHISHQTPDAPEIVFACFFYMH